MIYYVKIEMIEMEANVKQKKELDKEAILQFKKQMKWTGHLKNLAFVILLSIPGYAVSYYYLSGWIGVVGIITGDAIVLIIRYKMKYMMLPLEIRKLLRSLGYFENQKQIKQ